MCSRMLFAELQVGKEVALGWINIFIQTVGPLNRCPAIPTHLELKPISTYTSVV